MTTPAAGTAHEAPAAEDQESCSAILQLGEAELAAAFDFEPATDAFAGTDSSLATRGELSGAPRAVAAALPATEVAPAQAAAVGLAARCKALLARGRWATVALVAGSTLAGAAASSVVAWQLLSAQDARIAAQAGQFADQAAAIERMNRAAAQAPPAAAPSIDHATAAPDSADASPSPTAQAAMAVLPTPWPAAPVAPAEPPAAHAPAPSRAEGGICTIQDGPQAREDIRKCLEWFNRDQAGGNRPPG